MGRSILRSAKNSRNTWLVAIPARSWWIISAGQSLYFGTGRALNCLLNSSHGFTQRYANDGSKLKNGSEWNLPQSRWIVGRCPVDASDSNGCHEHFYDHQFGAFPFQFTVATTLFALAAFTGIAGVVALGENRTALPAPLPDGEVVSTGIYRFVRHPLYLSLILWALSWPLFWSSAVGLACSVFVIAFFDLKARHEERLLLRLHPAYADYALRVKRLVPGIY